MRTCCESPRLFFDLQEECAAPRASRRSILQEQLLTNRGGLSRNQNAILHFPMKSWGTQFTWPWLETLAAKP